MQPRFTPLVFGATTLIATVLTTILPAQAVVLFGATDTKYIAPTGEYASIPWGRVGFGSKPDVNNAAWPISPNWALRAFHVGGGGIGYNIVQNGIPHNVVRSARIGNTDLELVQVSQPFSSFFNMYNGDDEIGKEIVMFGNSAPGKGPQIRSEGTNRFNGWSTGGATTFRPGPGESAALNWGRNQVRDVEDVYGTSTLKATFDAPTLPDGSINPHSVGEDESIIYTGDSGGGFFIQQGGEWRLAGVIYAVDATYFKETDTVLSRGAIFDARDLWTDEPVDENFPNGPKRRVRITGDEPVPFGSYASRVSEYRSSINAITGETAELGVVVVPESATGSLVMLGIGAGLFGAVLARRRVG